MEAIKKYRFPYPDDVSNPVSLYAATKRANELMAESYGNLLFLMRVIGVTLFY